MPAPDLLLVHREGLVLKEGVDEGGDHVRPVQGGKVSRATDGYELGLAIFPLKEANAESKVRESEKNLCGGASDGTRDERVRRHDHRLT
jgi:hypothetical protein